MRLCHCFTISGHVIRLDPGGRRVKNRVGTGNVAAFIPEEGAQKSAYKTREQRGINIIGSWGEPMGKRAAVQGRPFALVRAYAANTHQS